MNYTHFQNEDFVNHCYYSAIIDPGMGTNFAQNTSVKDKIRRENIFFFVFKLKAGLKSFSDPPP